MTDEGLGVLLAKAGWRPGSSGLGPSG